ncbi:hypothetical protein [Absidia glauca]|uniref:Uncharacterized protein n=1 Tax=Absidia glauca TaxID=4829 RepID=A0A168NXK8_ABSGL|nr:hypothetical protein [Absidia glauca]
MADFFDEEFGFRCKRIISNPPVVTALTPNTDFDFIQQESTTPQLDETHVSLKDTRDIFIQKTKGQIYSHGDWRQQHSSSHHVLSPISPYTPHTHDQQMPSSYVSVNTLSPELTATYVPPTTPTTPFDDSPSSPPPASPVSPKDTEPVPEQQIHPSQFLSLIKSDLPKTERIRQLLLMIVRHELDKQLPASGTDEDGKDLDRSAKEYRAKMRNIGLQVVEKLSNREIDLFDNQHSGEGDKKFVYAEPNPKNERNRIAIQQYKALHAEMESEMERRKQAISEVYNYHARGQDAYQTAAGKKFNLGSSEDYISLMDPDQQAFIQSFKQANQPSSDNDIDTDGASTISSTNNDTTTIPPLQVDRLKISRDITELRQQLNYANEYQKEAREVSERIMKDISRKLKRDNLRFPARSKKHDTTDPLQCLADPLSSSTATSSSPPLTAATHTDHQDTTNDDYMEQRMKKRRILGLYEDNEMEAKATFEFLQMLSKLR